MTALTEPEKTVAAQNPKTERRSAARELRDAMPAALRAELPPTKSTISPQPAPIISAATIGAPSSSPVVMFMR